MLNRFTVACGTLAMMLPVAASAHHGLDFIFAQTAHLPEQGAGYAIGRIDYISEKEDEMEFEPALLYGATDWLTLELHAYFEKESGNSSEALFGYYGELSKRFSLNAGIGVGIDGGPDWSVRTAFIWQFK